MAGVVFLTAAAVRDHLFVQRVVRYLYQVENQRVVVVRDEALAHGRHLGVHATRNARAEPVIRLVLPYPLTRHLHFLCEGEPSVIQHGPETRRDRRVNRIGEGIVVHGDIPPPYPDLVRLLSHSSRSDHVGGPPPNVFVVTEHHSVP
jgi:hypothetical protein